MPVVFSFEKLLLYRRRRDWSQSQAARHFQFSIKRYQQWEHGLSIPPRVCVTNIKPLELYFLYRLREGWSQTQLAKKLKCSRWWLHQMETGKIPYTKLENFWKKQWLFKAIMKQR